MKMTKVEISYYDRKFTEQQRDVILKFNPPAKFEEIGGEPGLYKLHYGNNVFLVYLPLFMDEYEGTFSVLGQTEIPISSSSPEINYDKLNGIIEHVNKVSERMEALVKNQVTFNEKCHVHIGGNFLMYVNETKLLEDCCTNHLQSHIDEGWRIVACCVQPDGRRPDYIMGRYDKLKDL